MPFTPLLPSIAGLTIAEIKISQSAAALELISTCATSCCPLCRIASQNVHSYYYRKLMDAPWALKTVCIRLRARRFYCRNDACERQVFTERFGQEIFSYARRTQRVNDCLEAIGFSCGGMGGAILSDILGMPISPSTMLRIVTQGPDSSFETPRVLGVDDWAFRKGHVYGTILVDLERRKPVDLLPERSAESLEAWLGDHPGVEIISRDRASCYSEGAKAGAPHAVQVADRWHLLKNIGDTLQKLLNTHPKALRSATQDMYTEAKTGVEETKSAEQESIEQAATITEPAIAEAESRRRMNFEQVKILQKEGAGIREMSRRIGLHRQTVKKYMVLETLPPRAMPLNRIPKTTPFLEYLAHRWNEGETNLRTLFNEVKERGYTGSYQGIGRAKAMFADADSLTSGREKRKPQYRSLSARQTSMLLCKDPEKLNDAETRFCEALCANCSDVKIAYPIAREFVDMVKNKEAELFDAWLETAINSEVKTIENFAEGLKGDYDAVRAALSLPWSNGQVEGQVNRLKNIKRQMYGRAGFGLLRRRVLYRARAG